MWQLYPLKMNIMVCPTAQIVGNQNVIELDTGGIFTLNGIAPLRVTRQKGALAGFSMNLTDANC